MKRYLFSLFIIAAILSPSCKEAEVHTYIGKDYVQFIEKVDEAFSFVYAGMSVKVDTVWLEAHISGDYYPHKRYYKLRQLQEYHFEYSYGADGEIIDSLLVKTGEQAVPGVHYVPFDDPEYQKICYVDNDNVYFRIPIVVLRDPSLLESDKRLKFELISTGDLLAGDSYTRGGVLVISDMVQYPEAWSNYATRPDVVGTSPIFGRYGPVKHRFMIDITGKPWNNEFFDSISQEEKHMYKNICSKALDILNSQRQDDGLPPLREDPDDPNTEIIFP